MRIAVGFASTRCCDVIAAVVNPAPLRLSVDRKREQDLAVLTDAYKPAIATDDRADRVAIGAIQTRRRVAWCSFDPPLPSANLRTPPLVRHARDPTVQNPRLAPPWPLPVL